MEGDGSTQHGARNGGSLETRRGGGCSGGLSAVTFVGRAGFVVEPLPPPPPPGVTTFGMVCEAGQHLYTASAPPHSLPETTFSLL